MCWLFVALPLVCSVCLSLILINTDEQPSSGSDNEKQLLEAAKSGDLELVKVCV